MGLFTNKWADSTDMDRLIKLQDKAFAKDAVKAEKKAAKAAKKDK